MQRLTDAQVDRIARELAGRLGATPTGASARAPRPAPTPAPASRDVPTPEAQPGEGIFETVDECVVAARAAFEALDGMTLAKRHEIVAAIRAAMHREGDALARLAWEETGLGRYEDKVVKNRLVTDKTPGPEILVPETTTGDDGLTLTEWAPFGV